MKTSKKEIADIVIDLQSRLKSANKGKGMSFAELPSQRLMEYLNSLGVSASDLEEVAFAVTGAFTQNRYDQTPCATPKAKPIKEAAKAEDYRDLQMASSHPYMETKLAPRKTVFGVIKKITK